MNGLRGKRGGIIGLFGRVQRGFIIVIEFGIGDVFFVQIEGLESRVQKFESGVWSLEEKVMYKNVVLEGISGV